MADISKIKLPDGTTYNIKDTNTTYTLSVSGNSIVLTPSSGSANTITVPYATSAGSATDSTKMPLAGGTFTGAVTFANNTWNTVGDDVQIGDINVGGTLGIKGKNGDTRIRLAPYSGSTANDIYNDGNGNLTITGTTYGTFNGSLSGTATSATTASKLGSSTIGDSTTPIYLSSGTATACTYSLNKTVPSDAVFTDTKVTQYVRERPSSSTYYPLLTAYSDITQPSGISTETNYVTKQTDMYYDPKLKVLRISLEC